MAPQQIVIHTENNDFQYIETLRRNRTKRFRAREFFVEGVRAINNAVQYRWQINAFIYSRDRKLSSWAQDMLLNIPVQRHYSLPQQLMDKISQKEDTSEIIALVQMPEESLVRIPVKESGVFLVLDRPSSPGNLGTIIRSSDALGVDGIVITGHAADLYDPETIRATTGSFFAVPVVTLASFQDLIPWIEELRQSLPGLQTIGTSAKSNRPIADGDLTRPTVVFIGNETAGLSENNRSLCDEMYTIPMSGSASSMNVACATSIILYEISRQRASL
ncbi:MAG: rRNA methyltransferase [Anaerolineae bacterium]|nr:rRNA methyltransferase [Anaerolineae bacterium]